MALTVKREPVHEVPDHVFQLLLIPFDPHRMLEAIAVGGVGAPSLMSTSFILRYVVNGVLSVQGKQP